MTIRGRSLAQRRALVEEKGDRASPRGEHHIDTSAIFKMLLRVIPEIAVVLWCLDSPVGERTSRRLVVNH